MVGDTTISSSERRTSRHLLALDLDIGLDFRARGGCTFHLPRCSQAKPFDGSCEGGERCGFDCRRHSNAAGWAGGGVFMSRVGGVNKYYTMR